MMQETSRSSIVLMNEAELLSGSGDFVRSFYLKLSERDADSMLFNETDEHLESKLIGREDAFIDMTLARYSSIPETLRCLFQKSFESGSIALRIGCLSNEIIGKQSAGCDAIPLVFFERKDSSAFVSWFRDASHNELSVLFSNPTIVDTFLTEFLELDKDSWRCLDEAKQMYILGVLATNSRIGRSYSGNQDGFAEYNHDRLFSVIWDLAKKIPVTGSWGQQLGFLLRNTRDRRYDYPSLEVAARWVSDDKQSTKEDWELSGLELVRCALYQNIVSKQISSKPTLESVLEHLSNSDIAYRACCYANLKGLTTKNLQDAYERDGCIAVEYLMKNHSIWKDAETRTALSSLCLTADGDYRSNYLDYTNAFDYREREFARRHPDWFIDSLDGDDDDPEERVLTVGLAKEISDDKTYEVMSRLREVEQSLKELHTRIKWGFIGVLFYVVLYLLTR